VVRFGNQAPSETIRWPALMSSGAAPTQLRRRAALARLEAEELVDAVSELRTASLSKPELERALERVEALSARVQKALDLSGGLSVAQAAERLEVSEPTVRKWLAEGLLERVKATSRWRSPSAA
jgi:excisionase family DNA binding protein